MPKAWFADHACRLGDDKEASIFVEDIKLNRGIWDGLRHGFV